MGDEQDLQNLYFPEVLVLNVQNIHNEKCYALQLHD